MTSKAPQFCLPPTNNTLRFLTRETLINIAQLPKFHELISGFEKTDRAGVSIKYPSPTMR
jgi:hypothetical protein